MLWLDVFCFQPKEGGTSMTSSSELSMAKRELPWMVRLLRFQSIASLRQAGWGVLFATPWLLGLIIFVLGPILASLYFSLTRYDIVSTPQFLGIGNYQRAFFEDALMWPSLGRTLRYAITVVPLSVIGSLALAMLLNQGYRMTSIYRTLFFLPSLTPSVALAILWVWLFQPQLGPVNYALGQLGIRGPGWFNSPQWALPSMVIISLWGSFGGTHMLIFLSALQGVPQELYDAADVDGAGRWRKFLNVTLPMISPSLLFNLIMGVIGAMKVFTLAYVATQGGPARATWFYALHLYTVTFQYFEMGYGAALAWFFAFIVIVITLIQFRMSQHWVFYAGE
jgi:multiple sugar transport system permease protein